MSLLYDLLPDWCLTIAWNCAEKLSIEQLGGKKWNINQNTTIFVQVNAFENVACKMEIILSWFQYIKSCFIYDNAGLILGLHPANERQRYKVTLSLIGWAQT